MMKRRDFLTTAAIGTMSMTALTHSPQNINAEEPAVVPAENKTEKLRFTENGTFKIVQFTDTHYRTDKEFSKESVKLIAETLEAEKPQLAVYTGDIVVSVNIRQGWNDILAPCIERQIPWAVVLGNHDDEAKVSRKEIFQHIVNKPYSVTSFGPENIKGVGNYVLEILDPKNDGVKFLLYCLDSNAYSTIKGVPTYGWFENNQIAWYRRQSESYTKTNGGKPLPALAFFHIPLNEYGEMIHFRAKTIGERKENECPGAANSGMFLAMLECGDVMGTFVGHDHLNDYLGLWKGVALGYGRFSGTKTTYVKEPHGARILEISNSGERSFKTWIRLRGGEKLFNAVVPQDLIEKKEK
ncbi:MAG: metallophosphoesterase family protein [Planctomycetaceae bacterium]|jgi:hypothetical protein|nr:metallophosphoesterase family protein [Planctomycetaceae bacterium]